MKNPTPPKTGYWLFAETQNGKPLHEISFLWDKLCKKKQKDYNKQAKVILIISS